VVSIVKVLGRCNGTLNQRPSGPLSNLTPTATGTASGDSVNERLSLVCIKEMTTHPNRVSGNLPKEVVLTELTDPVNACRLNSVSHTNATLYTVIVCT